MLLLGTCILIRLQVCVLPDLLNVALPLFTVSSFCYLACQPPAFAGTFENWSESAIPETSTPPWQRPEACKYTGSLGNLKNFRPSDSRLTRTRSIKDIHGPINYALIDIFNTQPRQVYFPAGGCQELENR